MIDILVPVLNRPGNAQPLVDSIVANTKVPHQITFMVSADDDEEIVACRATGCPIIRCPEGGYAYKINMGASLTRRDFIFLGADDLRFQPDWDRAAIDRFHATDCKVIGTNDLANPTVMAGKHATHALVHRSYLEQGTIDEPGKLLHEGYHHQYVDNEFCDTARWRGMFAFAPDSYVKHLHPIWGTAEMDTTYALALNQQNARADLRLFQTRRRLWR